ncbi:hypothetical protein KSP40_PGU015897 [Platanthera guangdongensis]|uniref:Uncharacterized protein n=1 Tax=Platanthera guangdongensis TaxID=2320717 RepID=A0ABR2MP57_9ASPA
MTVASTVENGRCCFNAFTHSQGILLQYLLCCFKPSSKKEERPTQVEVFIETRSSISGKELDLETNNAIPQLQDTMNSG